MKKYLLDTCILSEANKQNPNKNYLTWFEEHKYDNFYISIMSIGEIQQGVKMLPESKKRSTLNAWLNTYIIDRFDGKIINIDHNTIDNWSDIVCFYKNKGRVLPIIDSLIAASAIANNCIIVTRNIKDFPNDFVKVVNPFISVD